MSTPPDTPHGDPGTEPEHAGFPVVERDDRRYLGTLTDETPAFHDPEAGRVYRGEVDEDAGEVRPREDHDWTLGAEDALGEFLERVGEEVGWASLSAYAREHLEREDA